MVPELTNTITGGCTLEDTLKQILDELKAVNQRLDKVDSRLDRVDGRLDQVDSRLDKVDNRLDQVDSRLDKMDHDLTEVKKLQQETVARVDLIEKQIYDAAMSLSADIKHLGKKVEVMNNRLLDVEANTL
jgi:DNA repair ATPase RecN